MIVHEKYRIEFLSSFCHCTSSANRTIVVFPFPNFSRKKDFSCLYSHLYVFNPRIVFHGELLPIKRTLHVLFVFYYIYTQNLSQCNNTFPIFTNMVFIKGAFQ